MLEERKTLFDKCIELLQSEYNDIVIIASTVQEGGQGEMDFLFEGNYNAALGMLERAKHTLLTDKL